MKKLVIIILTALVEFQGFALYAYADQNTATTSATPTVPSVLQSLGNTSAATDSASTDSLATQLSNSLQTLDSTTIGSSQVRRPVVNNLSKTTFQYKDHIVVSVYQGLENELSVKLFDNRGTEVHPNINVTNQSGNVTFSIAPPDSFVPGKYTVKVYEGTNLLSTQGFTWGVLAINTDKSVYALGENADIAIGVLDEKGKVVCGAKLKLTIVDPSQNPKVLSTDDKSIVVNKQCYGTDMTLTPDYEAHYVVGSAGTYQMTLVATTQNGDYTIYDSFTAADNAPFDLTRITATRLYPSNIYPVTLSGVANQDFTGKVTEIVPGSFTISRPTTPTIQGYDSITTVKTNTQLSQLPDAITIGKPFSDSYPVISAFGEAITDKAVSDWYIKNGLVQNDGIDFAVPTGTSIVSVDNGTIAEASDNGVYGTTIVIQHSWGKTYYGYLSSLEVTTGEKVVKGQEIALSGASGHVSQADFHFGVKPNKNDPGNGFFGKVNPSSLLGMSSTQNMVTESTQGADNVQVLTWNIDVKKGQHFQLGYTFQAPLISPQFYTLGPARFFDDKGNVVFAESRNWQLAVDTTTYQMQTGYYVGNTNPVHIAGLGFKPQLVIVKSDANTAGTVFSTTLMPGPNTAFFIATADNTAGMVNLETDGFTVSSTMSTVNVRYTWIAFTGADCSSSGMFCIGSYTGTGSGTQAITSVGFQPDLVWVKQTTAVAGNWRSSSMSTNEGEYFAATTEDTTGVLYTTLDSTGFTAGTTNNAAGNYYYVAFKNTTGYVNVGTYSGTGSAHGITGVGFQPDFVFVKNANAVTPVTAGYNVNESYGDNSSLFTATANATGVITSLDSDGFSVGTNSISNGSGNTIFYAAFGGGNDNTTGDGSDFKMESGSYTGTGNNIIISNLGFSPDLVVIKGETAQYGVFRTSLMGGDSTAYLANAVANFAGGIIAINPKGFTVGTSATVNTAATTYYWTAYGNAWDPTQNTGSSSFYIGAYYGNGIDNRNITRLPFQADMVTVKRFGATAGVFRTSAEAGDTSAFFAATADAANNIQSLNSDGFQIGGSSANVNTAANVYFYFGFKNGSSFHVGTYTGTGSSQNITSVGFQPDSIWIKRSTAVQGIVRTSDMNAVSNDYAEPFLNTTHTTGDVTAILSNGFTVGTGANANTNTGTYWYVAWKDNYTPTTPTYYMKTGYYIGNTNPIEITGLGFRPQVVIIKPDTSALAAMFSTTEMPGPNTSYFIGTADNATGWTNLEKDGFTVSGTASTANVRYTWIAFAGVDCSSSGMFCVGEYQGNGSATQAITSVGFQPDAVWVKRSTAVTGTFRTSSMATNVGQDFDATTQDTTGILFTTLDSTGFTVGSTNNVSAGIYYFVAFKSTANQVAVGTYSGTGSAHGITGVGFSPDFVIVKNANAGTPVSAAYNVRESYGDDSSLFTKTANTTGVITSLDSDGYTVGTNSISNGSGNTIYYIAFGGDSANTSSGTFTMKKGSYTGTGAYQRITDLGFPPDLIIIKGETTQTGVFRTSLMGGDSTAVMDAATANITGGITAINPNGFTVGTSATVNSSGVTYYWIAYGNAWNPATGTGASDFYVGAYTGNGIDSTNITRLPFQADMVTIKKSDATAQTGVWRTSSQAGDTSAFFAATNDTSNNIQALNSDGFQIGTAVNVNTAAKLYFYFGFKEGTNFQVGTYSGNGTSKSITDATFQPDNLWLKRSSGTATRAVSRTSDMATANTDWAEPFTAVAHITSAITATLSNGFSVGSAAEANANGVNYWYAAWQVPSVGNPTPTLDQLLRHGQWFYNGVAQAFTF